MSNLEEIRERLMDELSNAYRRHYCGVAYCGCYASAIATAEQIVTLVDGYRDEVLVHEAIKVLEKWLAETAQDKD